MPGVKPSDAIEDGGELCYKEAVGGNLMAVPIVCRANALPGTTRMLFIPPASGF